MDTENRRDEVLDAYEQGPEAVVELVARLVAELTAQWESVAARVLTLAAENAALRARLGTDSHNSSKPPSSDGPEVKPHPKTLRAPSGRKPGGQPGHVGHTLQLVNDPHEVQVHAPVQCRACGQSLERVATIREERRQVVDLPPLQVWVVEHQAQTKACPGCRVETTGQFPAGVAAPVQYGPGVENTNRPLQNTTWYCGRIEQGWQPYAGPPGSGTGWRETATELTPVAGTGQGRNVGKPVR